MLAGVSWTAATGVKTGTSLIASAKEGGEAYIAVVLDAKSEDYRFEGAQVALGYGFESFGCIYLRDFLAADIVVLVAYIHRYRLRTCGAFYCSSSEPPHPGGNLSRVWRDLAK